MTNTCNTASSGPKLFSCLKFLAVLGLGALASGCGREAAKTPATQVAAKVNGHEITVHQINDMLARQNVQPEQGEAAKRQILERLIDQELAKQQAIEKKLDRTPRTVQAIEAVKNEILARAYLEQIAAGQSKPGAAEVKRYYAQHPELFAQRRIYSIEELVVSAKQVPAEALKAHAARAKDLNDVAAWLKSQNAEVGANRGVRAAEQIPLAWLPEVHKMKDGEIRVFGTAERMNVIHVVATRAAPVDEATAAPRIEQFIFNRQLNDSVAKEVKHLRDKSNIEYAGEFAANAAAAGPARAAEAFQPAEPAPTTNPSFEKGIRGLR